jgi:hypothetical protein
MTTLKHGRFYFTDWSAPDPDDEKLNEAMHTARYDLNRLTQDQAYLILSAAEAYCYYSGHPAANKSIFKQLAELRAAIRAKRVREES